jgi:hypothetical protein
MAYAYRWTAVEDESGHAPDAPPRYYALNRNEYAGRGDRTVGELPGGLRDPHDAPFLVHPFRLYNDQGRLSGEDRDLISLPGTGPARRTRSRALGRQQRRQQRDERRDRRMLASDATVAEVFRRAGLPNPYAAPARSSSGRTSRSCRTGPRCRRRIATCSSTRSAPP